MSKMIEGVLEIDKERGVIYFHSTDDTTYGVTILRICRLPKPIPANVQIDITHMHGASYDPMLKHGGVSYE